MNEDILKAADTLLDLISKTGRFNLHLDEESLKSVHNLPGYGLAVQFMHEEGLLKDVDVSQDPYFRLTTKGIELLNNKRTFSDYWKAKEADKPLSQQMKELQIDFWKSGIARDRRQRWQFWLTFLLGAGGFVLGIFNFVKDLLLE